MIPLIDRVLLVAGIVISLTGMVLLYKKGLWLGFSISLLGIVLIVIAAVARLFS